MRLSGGQNIFKNHGLSIHTSMIPVGQRPLDGIEHYKKWKFPLLKKKAKIVFESALEGWSGTTWPLQLRQPGSTPGPFAIIHQYTFIGGGSHGY
jgi:hypothetical protein